LTPAFAVVEIGTVAFEMALTREIPDTDLAARFDGEPMVQSFLVSLPRGRVGRVWITTAEALAVPGFGRPWVAAELSALRERLGARAFTRALVSDGGVRLRAGVPAAALAIAA
jgi:hypothetical protein